MFYQRIVLILIIAFSAIIPAKASALSCGDIITENITLTEDLHCENTWYALMIGANNITLNLNGHTLSGPGAYPDDGVYIYGVEVNGRRNAKVINGTLRGFDFGIRANHADGLLVKNVVFHKGGDGVNIGSTIGATITDNQFIEQANSGVTLYTAQEQTSKYNQISNNEIYGARNAIDVCGGNSGKSYENKVHNNLILRSKLRAIRIASSNNNIIYNNNISSAAHVGIDISRSSFNTVKGNRLKLGNYGITIHGDNLFDSCYGSNANISSGNKITENQVIDFHIGIEVGVSSISTKPNVYKNTLKTNEIFNSTIGIYFDELSANNYATDTQFEYTVNEVVDVGQENEY
jgi:parallel beta-helix repeat protein